MIVFTDYHGTDDLALLLAPPNWGTPPKLTTEYPFIDIERALLGNETRRSFGLTRKHTLEYSTTLFAEFDATALRLGLNRLKTELVGVPLWADMVITAGALAPTGTTVNFDQPPARSGSRWLFLTPDSRTFEVVTVNTVGTTSLTFAARAGLAWPAGSRIYPLLFGRFDGRPQVESITPSKVNASFKVVEDSDITEKITAKTQGIDLVGSHIADFSLYKLWTMQPVSEPRWIDTTEADILFTQLGFGREEQAYAYQNWNRRGLEIEFDCRSRDEISYVETVFGNRLGPCRSFFVPTFRADLSLAADITAGDATFEIAESRYEDPAYDDIPGSAFLCFLNAGSVYPQRINVVDSTTITPESPVGQNLSAFGTIVSFLMLVRFGDTKLEWDYVTPSRARVKIKFLELPDEYTEPQADQATDAYLFDFYEDLDTATNRYRFTSFEGPIVFGGNTYLVAPFSLGERDIGLTLDDSCDLKCWRPFAGNPLNRFLPYNLNAPLMCTVTRVNALAPDDSSQRHLFTGQVTSIESLGPEWTAKLRDPVAILLDRNYPRPLYQTQDNVDVYSAPTGVDPDDFKSIGAISALSVGGNTFQITVTGVSAKATDWFSNGWFTTGAGVNQEKRYILKNTLIGAVQTVTIDRPLAFAVVSQAISLYAGYDGSREQRDLKFGDNIDHEGMPFMPDTNPSVLAADIATPTGGKK